MDALAVTFKIIKLNKIKSVLLLIDTVDHVGNCPHLLKKGVLLEKSSLCLTFSILCSERWNFLAFIPGF